MRCTHCDNNACIANFQTASSMHYSHVSNLETFVRFSSELLHFRQRHRFVGFIDQVLSFTPGSPLARVSIQRNRGSAFCEYNPTSHWAYIDSVSRQFEEIVRATIVTNGL